MLAGCGSDETAGAKAQSDCVAGGMDSFDAGRSDPFWESEGREDYGDYIVATCRQMIAEGALESGAPDEAVARRIAGEVITRMVASGQIRNPG
jgi:hypothetical protein